MTAPAPVDLRISLPWIEIAAEEHPAHAGHRDVTLLAMHGWVDNAASFRPLAAALPEWRTIAIDFPGHGRSQHRPAGTYYHYVDWVADVSALIDALDLERVVLVGHSMGAGVATLLAGARPDRFAGIVLLDGLGPLTNSPESAPEQMGRGLASRPKTAMRAARPYASLDEMKAKVRAANSSLTEDAIAALLSRGAEERDGSWQFGHDPRLSGTSLLRMSEAHVLAFCHAITCPALVVWAADGFRVPQGAMDARQAAIAKLEAHTVSGGHHVHLTHPERVAPLMRRFLDALEPQA